MPANTPPTDDPLLEQIAQDLVETIQGIAARQANEGGFYLSPYTAERPHPKQLAGDFVDGRTQIVQGMTEAVEEHSNTCSIGLQTYFVVRLDAAVPQKGDESLDRRLNLRAADVLRAVLADPTRGGRAINTDLAVIDGADEVADRTKGRIDLVLIVQHQQSRTDPTRF